MSKGGEPGGAHSGSGKPKPFDEFLRDEVERRRIERETNPHVQAEAEKLQRELEKVRQKKKRWRERHPYDFG